MSALFPDETRLGLLTDLYQLTMAAGYFAAGRNERCAFELIVRELPPERGYLIAAGLEQALDYLEHLRFAEEDVDYLRGLPVFAGVPAGFFDLLRRLRFDGDVWAVPEGTVVFAGEPILRVEASAIAAQIVETYLLSVVNYQTLVATKAARIVEAAGGAPVYDFGTRRAHGPHAGILAARASWIGGCAGTSNVWAARALGIPPVGTMAHAWVMAFEREEEAFGRFVEIYPQGAVLLLDTYDTLAAARLAVRWADRIAGVRLDSGDLAALARQVRGILDAAGAGRVRIVATGDLNEYKIAALRAAGAPIDAFGVGTDLVTSRDVPALGGVYKMVERAGPAGPVGVVKESSGKRTWPGRKQVYRAESGDLLCLADEPPRGRPLLEPVMQAGRRTQAPQSLTRIRERARAEREALPPEVRRITAPAAWPVRMSERLEDARRSAARRISQEAGDR